MGVVSILPFHPATPIMWVTGVVGQLLMTAIHGDAPISGVPTSDSRDDGMGVLGVCPTDTGDGEDVLSPDVFINDISQCLIISYQLMLRGGW
jgi:hypothetical protein